MTHVQLSPISSGADDCASVLVPVSVTRTDGESRADTRTEGGRVTRALKDIMCRLRENSACRGLPHGRREDGRSNWSCITTFVVGRAMAAREETARISDQ